MASKDKKSNPSTENKSAPATSTMSTSYAVSEEDGALARPVSLNLTFNGNPFESGMFTFIAYFNGKMVLESKWQDGTELGTNNLLINLNDARFQAMVASQPLVFILRFIAAKSSKSDPDPFLHPDNRAGATVDLLPLVLGQKEIFLSVRLRSIFTGKYTGCDVTVLAESPGETELTTIPLLLTMVSAHCMPPSKEGTVYISAIGLTDLIKPVALAFEQSLSTSDARNIVWAKASTAGLGANTEINVPKEDKFVPEDLELQTSKDCRSFYWNSLNRALVDSDELIYRLSSPFLIEVAGVPRTAKMEVRGRYLGWVDARALLQPEQMSVTVCTKLLFYNETVAEQSGGALLVLPPSSAKPSARDAETIVDEFGHAAYVIIRFDVYEPLVPKTKLASLYEIIGYPVPEGSARPIDVLDTDDKPGDPIVDARVIRKEGCALAVHKELANLACGGAIPMNKGIKRSAANRLLIRLRTLLKNFAPGDCSYIEWQDTVTRQHAASRRAVTASIAPQPPLPHLPDRFAAARCRVAGDDRIAEQHMKTSLKVAGRHPRSLICKTLRCLEDRNDMDAKNYLFEALNSQIKNRFLLWTLGAQEYDNGSEGAEVADIAFRIAVRGDYSDGTANAIAWAALHTFNHVISEPYGAHVAIKQMRKSYTLPIEWEKVLKRWSSTSGEEEVCWIPSAVNSDNPLVIAAAFFLCLRCFKFCESLLQCAENGCSTHGSNSKLYVPTVDLYYIRAASFLLKRQPGRALEVTQAGILKYGPSALMCQMRVTSLSGIRGWDEDCEVAFAEAENEGAQITPSILYKAALSTFKTNSRLAMERAARVHKLSPSGHTALLIGRIYAELGDDSLAERWCACAVKIEPLLSDAWAMLAILAMLTRNLDKARAMLRTAKQVGPITTDIKEHLEELAAIVGLETLPDSLVKNWCMKKNLALT